jgi:Protein of unknown function (DUF3306)
MSGPDNFLSRWARRKREAEVASSIESGVAPQPDPEAEPSLDLESLPSIESITESTDIRGFLRSGVPAELTRTALRQTWSSDPAIRDFIGIAENQWDFNDPKAIPGFGPLGGTDDVPALLARALGRVDRAADAIPELAIPPLPTPPAVIASCDDVPEQTSNLILPSAGPIIGARGAADEDAASTVPSGDATANRDAPPDHRRRHGSALPR